MARYQIILSYDGTEFHGFQRQGDDRTVQLEVENALRRMGWEGRSILAAGRTDTGVHASGQVIAFDMTWSHSTEIMTKALNAHLPQDIGVSRVQEASPSFHPRFDAIWRTYRYHIYFQPFRDPLRDRYAWRLWPEPPGWDLPQTQANLFLGTHDFQAFGSPMKPGGNTIRTVKDSFWVENGDTWVYEVTGNAFLRHMVRRVVYVQILTAMQKMSLEDLQESITMGVSTLPGIAPPNGLTLQSVAYEDGISGIKECEFVEK